MHASMSAKHKAIYKTLWLTLEFILPAIQNSVSPQLAVQAQWIGVVTQWVYRVTILNQLTQKLSDLNAF